MNITPKTDEEVDACIEAISKRDRIAYVDAYSKFCKARNDGTLKELLVRTGAKPRAVGSSAPGKPLSIAGRIRGLIAELEAAGASDRRSSRATEIVAGINAVVKGWPSAEALVARHLENWQNKTLPSLTKRTWGQDSESAAEQITTLLDALYLKACAVLGHDGDLPWAA
jgi:hypothetical protein